MLARLFLIWFILLLHPEFWNLNADDISKHRQKRYDDARLCNDNMMEMTLNDFGQAYFDCLRSLAYNQNPEIIKEACSAQNIKDIHYMLLLFKPLARENPIKKNCLDQIGDAISPFNPKDSDCPSYNMNELLQRNIPDMQIQFPYCENEPRDSCLNMINEIFPKFDKTQCMPTDFEVVIKYAEEIEDEIQVPASHRNCMSVLRNRAEKYSLPKLKCRDSDIEHLFRGDGYIAFYPNCVDESFQTCMRLILSSDSENYYVHCSKEMLIELWDKSLDYGFEVYPNVNFNVRKCVQDIYYRVKQFLCLYGDCSNPGSPSHSSHDSDDSNLCGFHQEECQSKSESIQLPQDFNPCEIQK